MQGAANAIKTLLSRQGLFLVVVSLLSMPSPAWSDNSWLLVESEKMTLSVMSGNAAEQIYKHISLGRGGISSDRVKGDQITPRGEYHISRVSSDSPFHVFIGLDYPNLEQATRALLEGKISARQYGAIRKALAQRQEPPQDTALGGNIGIHGVGSGSTEIHRRFNWTNGCVALTNEQVDDLARRIYVGMRVVIR